jgi:phosphatidylglycerophosphate synthase
MLDAPIRKVLATPLNTAAGTLQRIGLGANFVTVTGFILGLIAIGAIASESYLVGLAFLLLNRIADGLDGALARRTRETPLGGFLDATLGVGISLGVAFAYAIARQQNGLAAAFLMLGLTLVAATDLAARAFAPRSAAAESEPALVICEKTETYIFFILMTQLWQLFALFAYAYGALCLVSAGMRLATAASSLSNTAKS